MYAKVELTLRYTNGKTITLKSDRADVAMFVTSIPNGNWVTIQAAAGGDNAYENLVRQLSDYLRKSNLPLFYLTITVDDVLAEQIENFCFCHADIEYGKIATIKLHD